ncbi:E3 SUMO-protein ligase ZBED1-like [Dreissena polymorpha]|uniref:E3 SUMO-protein ligase ZBED1-like n=1 Tax=Dreissena polymorpha TaxID=45954 RepID=UPI0022641DD8|nr:E3 SUMO-protein ligase ZBED1-like [Dreissena polymorpha]
MVIGILEDETPKKQSAVTSFFTEPLKSERITQAIANMIVSDYVPLSIVEGEGFKNLMSIVAPDYTVPCRKTIPGPPTLPRVSSPSLNTDAWDLKSNVLITRAMSERHTGENLAHRLKDCVTEFSLDSKVDTCMHDNARNNECAASLCEDWGDLGCFAHSLQLTLKPAMELPSVSTVVSGCRKLVGHFKHSTTLTLELGVRQKTMNVPQHTLTQDVPTRWNSTYLMMEHLVEQQRVLTDIMLDPKLTKKQDATLNLRESDWAIIKELCVILKPLADTTAYMSTESHVSVSEIYPIVCGLVTKSLESCSTDSSIAQLVKKAIRDDLVHRFQPES